MYYCIDVARETTKKSAPVKPVADVSLERIHYETVSLEVGYYY